MLNPADTDKKAWIPWAFGSNLHAGGLNDDAKYHLGFSWAGAEHDTALDHKGAAGSSLHEINAFWSALLECMALLDDTLLLQSAKSWTHPSLHRPPRVCRDDGKIKRAADELG